MDSEIQRGLKDICRPSGSNGTRSTIMPRPNAHAVAHEAAVLWTATVEFAPLWGSEDLEISCDPRSRETAESWLAARQAELGDRIVEAKLHEWEWDWLEQQACGI